MTAFVEFVEAIIQHTPAFWLAVEAALAVIFACDLVAIGLELRRVRAVPARKNGLVRSREWPAHADSAEMSAYHPIEEVRRISQRARAFVGGAGRRSDRALPVGSRTIWVGLGLVVIGLIAWALWPAPGGDHSKRFGATGPQPVGVAKVEVGDLNVTLTALGTVTPLASVTVRPQVSGPIIKFDFQEGQMVRAGDTLAEIDPRPYRAALDQAKGQLARDSAALGNARADLARFQSLWDQKAISQQQLANQSALVKQDEGVIESDSANVRTAEINLGYTRISAPIAGRVGLRQVDLGNLVQAGQSNGIAVVTQLEPISVLFTVPEDDVDEVTRQLHSGATLPVDVYDRDRLRKLATGKLSAVDTEIDTATGTVKLRATFDNADEALFPNQFVNVQLLVSTLHDQIIVPRAAIQSGADGTFVYVVNNDSTVSTRPVTLGPADGDRVSIALGLTRNELVVVDGADRLRDGMAVVAFKGQHAKIGGGRPGTSSQLKDLRAKLTPAEREQLHAMSHDERKAWMKAHKDELMKRKDQQTAGASDSVP